MVVLKRLFSQSLEALKVQRWIKALDVEVGGWWAKQIRVRGEERRERERVFAARLSD